MIYHGSRPLALGLLLLCLGSGVEAEVLTITTTQDTSLPGECSLRDAVEAINFRKEVNECPAGNGNDIIRFAPGAVYELAAPLAFGGQTIQVPRVDNEGEPVLDENEQPIIDDVEVNPRVTLQLDPEALEDDEVGDNAILVAAPGERIIHVREKSTLTVSAITLRDGDVSAHTEPEGGLILADGNVTLQERTLLENGRAAMGGAIYLTGTATLTAVDARFLDNTATVDGGAISMADDYKGTLNFSRFYFAGNHSDGRGGVLFGRGAVLTVVMRNGTLLRNSAAAGGTVLHMDALTTTQNFALNNLTLVENEGTGSALGAVYLEEAGDNDVLINSVLVANTPSDCAGPGMADLTLAYVVTGPGCAAPLPEYTASSNIQGGVNLSNAGDISVLRNADGPCVVGTPCDPIELDEPGFLPGYLPEFTIAAGSGVPALLDTGSPTTGVEYICESSDQRGNNRAERCDIGANEFMKAEGQVDSFNMVIGQTTEMDVVANDLGDALIDCNLVPSGEECIRVVIPSTRPGTVITADIDANGYPVLVYQFGSRYDGYDFFEYLVHRDAFAGITFGGADVGARVAVSSRPASGMTESKNVDDFGGVNLFWLGLLALAGAARRGRRAWPLLALLCAGTASAAEITVDSLDDVMPPAYLPGTCTLREAIHSGIDKQPNLSGCTNGQTGQDVILLPEGTITLAGTLEISAQNRLVIEGEGVDKTIIDADGVGRLFTAGSQLVLRNMTLRNGNAGAADGGAVLARAGLVLENVRVENNSAASGGAIYLAFNNDESSSSAFRSVYFNGNTATLDGGAMSMFAQTQRRDLEISSSTFAGNVAGLSGGAVDANQKTGSLVVMNSTFIGNQASVGGSALDVRDSATSFNVVNSTFMDNTGGAGQIDLGEPQTGEAGNRTLSNSIYAGIDQACSSGTRRFNRSLFNLFSGADASCTAAGTDQDNTTGIALPDIRAALNGGVLYEAPSGQDYELPHLPITDPLFTDIIDAGNPAALAEGSTGVDACRSVDLRNAPRTAGEQCDRGAYELQVITAVEDSGGNDNRRSRTVVFDVLANDVPGDGYRFRPGTMTLTKVTGDAELPDTLGEAFTRLRKRNEDDEVVQGYDDVWGTTSEGVSFDYSVEDINDPELFCGEGLNTDGSTNNPTDGTHLDQDCVVVYRLDEIAGQPSQVQCDALPYDDYFRYTVESEDFTLDAEDEVQWGGHRLTTTGLVKVTIANLPPRPPREAIRRTIEPGGQVTIDLIAAGVLDVDGEIVGLSLPESGRPLFAARDPNTRKIEGTGIIFNEAALTVTYIHADTTKRFKDTFLVRLEDDCGSNTDVSVEINFPQVDGAGGNLGGGGSPAPWALLCGGLLLSLRRRVQ
ncbi:hypothetical protein S7S_11555 [Isoalcanivorax pacificus W11-5]|uniref:CSLREA domain-containing protein n=1 Tax=Isoalcanivorax pacificus W11-5 TaxID=391936 RepID=A0A0B4XQI6_9GAMM|nr:choice-of-anchor Q domain-containing protein [Isoalcanivorax pacificus]AJD48723.1 hypothetical protein S7S_11555 [Isoalcanivorax pacificus W11-5]